MTICVKKIKKERKLGFESGLSYVYFSKGVLLNIRKIPMISPGLVFVQKAFFAGLIFRGAYFLRGLLSEGVLRFKMGWA